MLISFKFISLLIAITNQNLLSLLKILLKTFNFLYYFHYLLKNICNKCNLKLIKILFFLRSFSSYYCTFFYIFTIIVLDKFYYIPLGKYNHYTTGKIKIKRRTSPGCVSVETDAKYCHFLDLEYLSLLNFNFISLMLKE